MLPIDTCFSASYREARERLLTAAAARGLSLRSYVHDHERGAQAEDLAMDVAWVGAPDAKAVVLVSSGVHGVEGFAGSGCQLALLHDEDLLARSRQSGVALMLVHAVNPYGFSHLRRVNEDNVDVNRNFLDFLAPAADASTYAALHPLLVPEKWPPSADNAAQLGAFIQAHGQRHFQQVVTGGQRARPDGLFYTGDQATWSNLTLRAALREHLGACAELAWIDLHTGLGPCGHGEKIHAGSADPTDLARSRGCWGADVFSTTDGQSFSETIAGHASAIAAQECPGAQTLSLALEFGTCDPMTVLQALRADQWLSLHPQANEELRRSIKQALRDAFYIDTPVWQAMVYGQTRVAVLQALSALASNTRAAR